MKRIIATCLGLACITPALALPPAFEARYELDKYGMTLGQSIVTLKTRDQRLEYQSVSKARGMARLFVKDVITETSRLESLKPDSPLQVVQYSLVHSHNHDKDRSFQIKWDSNRHGIADGLSENRSYHLELDQPVYDRFSVQLQMMRDLENDSKIAANYRYTVLSNGRLREYNFVKQGDENFHEGNKIHHTIKFVRSDKRRKTILWLSSRYHFLPYKLEQYKDDELVLKMQLSSYHE